MDILMKLITTLLGTALLSASYSAIADTDVYLTNNSNQILSLAIEHTGSDLLEKGDEWLQHADTLGPYETKMILSMNRWEGVKSGQTYYFETTVTNDKGNQVTLNQTLKGTWYNTQITYGASSESTPLSLKDDRNIHRLPSDLSADDSSTEIAFKSTSTARYDDLYYSLTPKNVHEAQLDNADELKVMTYNIWALPAIARHIDDRMAEIPDYVKGYDALLLQEVFAADRDDFLMELAKEYPYQSRMLNKKGINIYDGGVIIVSRYPIVNEAQYVYPDCSGTDCFADKGVNYVEIIKDGRAYHLFDTHAASYDTDIARENRQKQFAQIRALAASLNIPANESVVYGGDMNVNKLKFPDDYANMFKNLNASEPDYAGYTLSTFDPRINPFAGEPGDNDEFVEYLDYIVVSKEYKQSEENTNTVKVPRTSSEALWSHWDLSDHFPVKAEIR